MKKYLFCPQLLAATGLAVAVGAAALAGLPQPARADYRAAEAAMRANNMAEAIPLLQDEAKLGNPVAAYNLGKIFETGAGGIQPDLAQAATWYKQAADIGATQTQFDGTELGPQAQDLIFAAQLYAQYSLGRLYEAGRGVPQDSNEAVRWYRRAADQELDLAQLQLVRIYRQGSGAVAPNLPESTKWLERVAQGGNVGAMTDLGTAYLQGIGVEKNAKTAHDWYERAAAYGNAEALYNLGLLYQSGFSGTPDPVRAADYYNKAANRKSGRAMLALGDLYFAGRGVPRNPVQALVWYELAADNGVAEAVAKRDALSRDLPEAQVDQANTMAASWQPQPDQLIQGLQNGAQPATAPAAAPAPAPADAAPAATAPAPATDAAPAPSPAPAADTAPAAAPAASPAPSAASPAAAPDASAATGTSANGVPLVGTPPPGAKPFTGEVEKPKANPVKVTPPAAPATAAPATDAPATDAPAPAAAAPASAPADNATGGGQPAGDPTPPPTPVQGSSQ